MVRPAERRLRTLTVMLPADVVEAVQLALDADPAVAGRRRRHG